MVKMNDKPSLNPALKEFWVTPARNRVLYGGRASSKSWDAAGIAIFLAQYTKIRVLCVRQFQNKISESVYSLLKIQIERFRLENEFRILNNKIICATTGSEFLFYGLARNISEIKSIESIDILWSEESHLLSKEQWEILEPTIRKEDSQCWFIFNPRLATDFVYKRFVLSPPPNTIVRKINYDENPFLSKTMLEIINATKSSDPDKFTHVYLGEPNDNDTDSIIKRSWILAAIDAHKKLKIEVTGSKRKGFDVADDGEDYCATVDSIGVLTTGIDLWKAKEDEILKSCSRVHLSARLENRMIVYDAIGVGSSCGAKFNELGYARHKKFFAGGAVINPDKAIDLDNAKLPTAQQIKNKDFYSNIKAQAWWLVAERLKNTYNAVHNAAVFNDSEMLFISSDCEYLENLTEELSTPRKSFDSAGRVKVESKDDLKKRGIPSPNIADAFIMANLPADFLNQEANIYTPMRIKGL